MLDEGFSPSTIFSYASAIALCHKLLDQPDPTSAFLLNQFLKGAKKLHQKKDARLPITPVILQKIIAAMEQVNFLYFHRLALQAIFRLAFAAFLRMGEICLQSGGDPKLLVQRSDVLLEGPREEPFCNNEMHNYAL